MNRDRLWGLIWIAAVGTVVLLSTLLGIVPKVEESNTAAHELTTVEAQNTKHEAALATLKADFANIDELRDDLADVQLGIPLAADIPAFVVQLDAIAAQHQVTLDQISISDGTGYVPVEPVAAATGTDATTDAGAVASTDESVATAVPTSPGLTPATYISIPVSIEASGTSSTVLDFLAGLQYGNRIIAINTFSIDAGTTSDIVTISIVAEIYVLTDPSAQAAE